MRILGNAFNGAREFYYTDWKLSYTAGSARWFPEFTPVNLVALRFMFDLLKHFLRHDVSVIYVVHSPPTLRGRKQASNGSRFLLP